MLGPVRWIVLGSVCGLACSAAPAGESAERATTVTRGDSGTTTEAPSATVAPASSTTTTEQSSTTTTGISSTTVTGVTSTATSTTGPVAVEPTGEQGDVFLTMNGVELTMDVRVPPDGGDPGAGRPVVVLFHGLSSATNDADDVTVVADAAIAAGMVVFSPEWIGWDPFPILLDDMSMLRRAGECAVAYAQEHAPRFGADPARTVTSGFSAGTGPALTSAIEPVTGEVISGCVSPPATEPVVGTVLGDGEYFWHSAEFDEAFGTEPIAMLDETVALIEPSTWQADPDLRIRLWAAGDGTAARPLDPATNEADWLTARDPGGSIRAELGEIGALDDGRIDDVDSAALLERRAVAAGFDVEFEVYPGGHTTNDKVPAIVSHLLSAAGAP